MVILLIGILFFAFRGGKDDADNGNPNNAQANAVNDGNSKGNATGTGRDLAKVDPDFTLTVSEYAAEHEKDVKAAIAKYEGKVIELTGKIEMIGANVYGDRYLSLETPGEKPVTCYTKMKDPTRQATPGQTVKVRGIWTRHVFAALAECQIIEVSGERCPELTADQLGKEHDANPMATNMKYAKRQMVLEGEIARKYTDEFESITIDFKHGAKCRIECNFAALESEQTKNLTVGGKMKVIGEYRSFKDDGNTITLMHCMVLDE